MTLQKTNLSAQNSELYAQLFAQTRLAQHASRLLANASSDSKNAALQQMAIQLLRHESLILEANALDIEQATARGMKQNLLDRLTLTPARLQTIAAGVEAVVALPDPIGVTLASWQLSNGMQMEKRSVPLGVIVMIYEARPNVTVDAASLTIKTGNAVVLRGSSDALRTNRAITKALREALQHSHLPIDAIQLVEFTEHEAVDYLVRMNETVDLVIPRGGAGLIQSVLQKSTVPVIETGVGNCHVYVDSEADPEMATRITLNAKTQRPSVCNSTETLLVHEKIAPDWLPQMLTHLHEHGVELHGCERTRALAPQLAIIPANQDDWATEYLDLKLAVKIVADVEEAIEHITNYGTRHTESIVTRSEETAALFLQRIDATAVYHNASTRLTDGFVYGFGAEIGISTQKLHARGPMGLQALTSYKYIGYGNGQIVQ
ncbi:glutamate-5-semialdehyde dehydrogenase [Tengunoibacter tsumagoiensis]|uniref:Gamma-glutamyl phosphate reductase n=1 Tax=Tengunoibacter tsumagoiensis TaxID=2014871 RepID=A0A402AAV6_9CHLR|nr:glutamate-5-semialdehyde dehydrogenase [Tengunoibacter tsumagoiensis]GCE16176.1 gamma-glutamyl phosphate reductase [Tengunoibacter tsumagoiensis]